MAVRPARYKSADCPHCEEMRAALDRAQIDNGRLRMLVHDGQSTLAKLMDSIDLDDYYCYHGLPQWFCDDLKTWRNDWPRE